jgi:hypothetical protein
MVLMATIDYCVIAETGSTEFLDFLMCSQPNYDSSNSKFSFSGVYE